MTETLAERVAESVVAAVVPAQVHAAVGAAPAVVTDAVSGCLADAVTAAEVGAHLFTAVVADVKSVTVARAVREVANTERECAVVGAGAEVTRQARVRIVTQTDAGGDVAEALAVTVIRAVSNLTGLRVPWESAVAPAAIVSVGKTVAVVGAVLGTRDILAVIAHPTLVADADSINASAVGEASVRTVVISLLAVVASETIIAQTHV